MCPACMTTVALVLTGGLSTGGLAGLLGRYVYQRRRIGTEPAERSAPGSPAALHKPVKTLKSPKVGV